MHSNSDFVGRQQKMGQLTAALDEVLSGQGRVVVLAGELLPEGIREVITRRVDRLPQPTNQVLTMASVIGREFDHALLC